MKAKDILQQLSSFPHRGATSNEEKKAAEFLKQSLDGKKITADIESFKAISTYSWEVILISILMIAGLIISPWLAKLGTAIVLLGFWSYTRHFMGHSTIFTKFIPKKISQNVVAKIPAQQETARNIILMAHYDSARASSIFAPKMVKNFRKTFLLNTYIGVVSIVWAYMGDYWGATIWFKIVCGLLALNHLVNVIIHIHREVVHRFVPGINDNGSGVAAVFEIAERLKNSPLQNSNLWIVFTGCEEAGIQGAKAFLDQHCADLPVESTFLINLDNIGYGNLHYATGEGMLLYYKYDESLINLCDSLAEQPEYSDIRPLEYRRAYFDALVFTQHGYPSTTLIALDDQGLIPNWHWYSDTIDNIDYNTIQHTVDFTTDLITKIVSK
ncbi:MAG: M20/M25/M40 family metallo-hydrolase [Candidatus Marinimicrobia bacterium]|nr:M20/M25/M40 family metallo-hydrolase [bacterium]MCG2716410.1 M20/M25/M40 family metallo-hydrolase [Candidatus Neomarinimicrobiota bacterium]